MIISDPGSETSDEMRKNSLSLCFLLLVVLLVSSCRKQDLFDPEAYQQLINDSAPISNIDSNHTWNLTTSYTVDVELPADADVQYVQILDGNPNTQSDVEILAEQKGKAGSSHSLFFYAPLCQKTLYAAQVTMAGTYLVKAFNAGQSSVVIDGDAISQESGFKEPSYQAYTYLFEEEYPKPSADWDFNDVVLRIQKLRSSASDEIRLKITLAAVGATKQIAAAVRLVGYDYDDISSVTIEEGRSFDNISVNYNIDRTLIKSSALLLEGENDEAVLNLFEDAHWVMSPRLTSDGTGVMRMFYNTSRTVNGTTTAQMRAKTRTYVIKFSKTSQLSKFTLENLDPFIIEDFNSGKWEVHTYDYKAAGVLHDYGSNETATSTNMVWALKIPSGSFRWAQEGENLGYYKKDEETGQNVLTGAYMTFNHSFGQWVTDHTTNLDWFRYPATGLVY